MPMPTLDWTKLRSIADLATEVLPVAVQEVDTGQVLMVAYVNRQAVEESIERVASVASFFVSRIDALVDPLLEKFNAETGKRAGFAKKAHGQVAIASAKMAYQIYKEMFGSDRFGKLTAEGALVQRLLWASTSTSPSCPSSLTCTPSRTACQGCSKNACSWRLNRPLGVPTR